MKALKVLNFTFLAASLIASAVAHAGVYESLNPDDQAKINGGQQVVKTEDVDGSAWPRITVLQRGEATPEELAAVMFDYPLHTKMFEGIIKSKPKNPGAKVTDVDYEMSFPTVLGISLPVEVYTVTDKLTALDSGYEISWTLVKASSMKDSSGSVKFERLGTGTLVSYTSFISPPRPAMARMITKMAVERVKDTVKALLKQAQTERASDQAKLNEQRAALKKALE